MAAFTFRIYKHVDQRFPSGHSRSVSCLIVLLTLKTHSYGTHSIEGDLHQVLVANWETWPTLSLLSAFSLEFAPCCQR